MDFTKEQLSDVFIKHLNRGKGLQDIMELMIESMMQAERCYFPDANPDNKGNGFRQGKSYGNGRVLQVHMYYLHHIRNLLSNHQGLWSLILERSHMLTLVLHDHLHGTHEP